MKRSGRNNIMDAIESGINSLFFSGRFIVFRQFCQIISVVDLNISISLLNHTKPALLH